MRTHYSVVYKGSNGDAVSIWASRIEIEGTRPELPNFWFYPSDGRMVAGFICAANIERIEIVVDSTTGKYEQIWPREVTK